MRRVYTHVGLVFWALFLFITSPSIVHATTSTISTCTELQSINPNTTTTTYVLINNIDCSGIPSFTPISNFHSTLDGDGFTISNLTVTGYINEHGLFSYTTGATIRNLKMTNASIQGNFEAGILVANAVSTTISNVSVQGSIRSGAALSLTGGLAGNISNSTILNSSANITSNLGYSIFGGLVGTMNSSSTISSSYATGQISIFSSGGNSELGGLVGDNINSTISNSYATVSLQATGDKVGGLVGKNEGTSQIINSYSTGLVSSLSGSNLGGLVGFTTSTATTTNSYWDTQTSGKATSAGGTSKTTSEMQMQSTFTGWDFNTIWTIGSSSYPTLRGIDTTAPIAPGIPTTTSPIANNYPTVTWTASTDAGGLATLPYTIQWSTSSNFSGTVYSSSTAATSLTPSSTLADGQWYFRVQAHDLAGNTSSFTTSSAIIIDTLPPTISLLGSITVTHIQSQPYTDAGASASDTTDGDLTAHIVVTGSVNTNAVGTYTLTYTVADAAGNAATSVSRTVIVQPPGGGSGNGSWGGGIPPRSEGGGQTPLTVWVNGTKDTPYHTTSPTVTLSFNADPTVVKEFILSLQPDFNGATRRPYTSSTSFTLPAGGIYTLYIKFYSLTNLTSETLLSTIIYNAPAPSPISASSPSKVPEVSETNSHFFSYFFSRNLRRGMSGSDVRELQKFLNAHGFTVATQGAGSPGQESTYFGTATLKAVTRFQEAHADQLLAPLGLTKGTGLFLEVTRTFVNQNF